MAIARKPSKAKAAPLPIDAEAFESVVAEASEAVEETVYPAVQDTLDAALEKTGELQEQLRLQTEQGIDQSRKIFERVKTVAEDAAASLETSYAAASRGANEIGLKAIDAFKTNSDAHFEFVKALLATKSMSDAIALQGEHARAQFEMLNAQAKEIQDLMRQFAQEAVEPLRATISKTLQPSI